MSGLLRRIRRTRPPAQEPAPDEGTAWDETEQTPGDEPGGAGAIAHARDLPAGTDLDRLVGDRPTTKRRSRLRRRLRHLRRVRELLMRDLGGLMFEIHRSEAQTDHAHGLVEAKLARLASVHRELRELEEILDDRRGMVLREPGIGGSCPLCGELHGSDARFCWACGTPVAPGAVRPVVSVGSGAALGAGAEGVQTWTTGAEAPPEPVIEGDAVADEPEPEPAAVAAPDPEPEPEPEPEAEIAPEAPTVEQPSSGAWPAPTDDGAWDGWSPGAEPEPAPTPEPKPKPRGRRR